MVAKLGPASPGGLADFREKVRIAGDRPVLCHLNADTSWLLSLAYPSNAEIPAGRARFNILIDPWFTGSQSDVASWFSTQYHAIKASIQSVAEINGILFEAETALLQGQQNDVKPLIFYVDAVVISHEFTDHCHKATLLELPKSTPVFSTTKAVQLIRSWNYFHTVVDVPSMSKTADWRTTSVPPLPPWLGISRLITQGNSLYYHSAIIICIPRQPTQDDQDSTSTPAEAIIYTPHGVESSTFSELTSATPPIQTLAFLHGLHDVSITLTKQLNLGAHNAFKAQKLLKPKYWVGTHDEVKRGLGLIGPLLRRKQWTIEDAVKKDRSSSNGTKPVGSTTDKASSSGESEEENPFVPCENGQSLILS